jgi:HEAT repeat protein
MAKDRVPVQLENLKTLRAAGASDHSLKELRKALNDKVNVIVAKAAAIAGEWQAQALLPDLTNAFSRLFVNPAETDPQCWAKNAISKALKDLGCVDSALFLRGLQHQQWESTWGGKTDTAAILRGTCALALVPCADIPRDDTLLHLVDAVTDSDARVRADAARAIEQMGGRDAGLLLRLKARSGDKEARVTGQVLESILQMEGARAISFVAAFLQHGDEEVSEEAALALGASRLPPAVELLQEAFLKLTGRRSGESLLRAISASRLDSALAFLLHQVRTARLPKAEEALHALALHRDSEQIVKQVEAAVTGREDLLPVFQKNFR